MFLPVITFLINLAVGKSSDSFNRVIGGQNAPEELGRYHVSLQNLTGYHVCGGVVISEKDILTAAHCVEGALPDYIVAVVGTTDLDRGGRRYNITSISLHPDYHTETRQNDIAMLTITSSFDLSYVDVIEINEKELLEGDTVTLAGFGAIESNGESVRRLQALDLPVFNQDTCIYAMRYSLEVIPSMFCTFTQVGEGTCYGDSGHPLVKDNKLVGLVSWGIPCAVGFPDVHIRVTPYISWIQTIKNKV